LFFYSVLQNIFCDYRKWSQKSSLRGLLSVGPV